ncbi:hypothetical protein BPAE_0019g00550 [Botrytis paeoniae]|uniref:Uncharacterized protein n=1 Tax=Botrytis paeoniae TaxID=278948 RepID=A0A4Z1G267_9HELO|nr:hypothetical protein BPAE_0019g00550 [Botrytis paeoniae]
MGGAMEVGTKVQIAARNYMKRILIYSTRIAAYTLYWDGGQETVVVLGYKRKEGDVIPLSALISCATESALRCNTLWGKGCIVFASTRMRKLKLEIVF